MVWCLVENTTPSPFKVATYNAGDFLLQKVPANKYILAAGETRLVSAPHTSSFQFCCLRFTHAALSFAGD